MSFLSWRFDKYLHIAEELEVVYVLVVVLRFQIYKVEMQGFFRYAVADVEYIRALCPSDSSSACISFGGIE